MRVLFVFLIAIFLYSCSEANKKPQVEKKIIPHQIENVKKLSIRKVGELRFRRSYADIQFREMSNAELEKIRKSNPEYYYAGEPDSFLLKRLETLNYLDQNYDLFRNKFKINKSKEFEVTGNDSIALKCWFIRPQDTTKYDKYNLVLNKNNLNTEIEIEGFYSFTYDEIKYLLLDIIPGGFKEVLVLSEYYFMNGDNSDLFIYEIKYN